MGFCLLDFVLLRTNLHLVFTGNLKFHRKTKKEVVLKCVWKNDPVIPRVIIFKRLGLGIIRSNVLNTIRFQDAITSYPSHPSGRKLDP